MMQTFFVYTTYFFQESTELFEDTLKPTTTTLCTQHNWSPYQLWYHSSIAAHNDDPIDLNDYGLDPQGAPPNGFDVDSVEVPTTDASLSPTQMSLVANTIDP